MSTYSYTDKTLAQALPSGILILDRHTNFLSNHKHIVY